MKAQIQVGLDQLADVEKIEFSPLAANYPKYNIIKSLIVLATIFTPALVILTLANVPFVLHVAVAMIPIAVYVIWCSREAALCSEIAMRQSDILLRRGIFWKSLISLPFKRVQHIDLTHGPLERKFSLASLKLFTAGGSRADLIIHGLEKEKAEQLRAHILKQIDQQQEQLDDHELS